MTTAGPVEEPKPHARGRIGAAGLVLGGALSIQFGAGIAALLFPRVGALGVVTLRLTVAAIVLLVACRPRLGGHSRSDWVVVGGFGAVLAGMNTLFYQAIERIPLGAAVTLEVLGPLTLSVLASRRALSWLWAALALAGVLLLGHGGFALLNAAGVAFALGAGAMWAAYILLSAQTGRRFARADGLALAMTAAAVVSAPLGVASAGTALVAPATLAMGAGVAALSSVLPYTLELVALRRLASGTFAVLMSLDPAIAAAAGYLVLGQILTVVEGLAIGLVVVASVGAILTPPARRRA